MHGVEVCNILDLCHPPCELMLKTHTHLCLKEGTAELLLPRGQIVGEPQLSRGKLGSMLSPTQQLTTTSQVLRGSQCRIGGFRTLSTLQKV
jgi:hypothetical protein